MALGTVELTLPVDVPDPIHPVDTSQSFTLPQWAEASSASSAAAAAAAASHCVVTICFNCEQHLNGVQKFRLRKYSNQFLFGGF